MKRGAFLAVAVLLTLAGCASTPQASLERDAEAKRFRTDPRSAAIYVYRNDFSGPDVQDSVLYLDDRLIGATLPGTYFRVDVRPGVHLLRGIGVDNGWLKMETRPGGLDFVALNVISQQSLFRLVAPAAGKRDLERCCVLLENWAPGQRPLFR